MWGCEQRRGLWYDVAGSMHADPASQIWMVHPHLRPPAALADADPAAVPRPPRVEYLATLSRHSAAVNVVRFSPNGT